MFWCALGQRKDMSPQESRLYFASSQDSRALTEVSGCLSQGRSIAQDGEEVQTLRYLRYNDFDEKVVGNGGGSGGGGGEQILPRI